MKTPWIDACRCTALLLMTLASLSTDAAPDDAQDAARSRAYTAHFVYRHLPSDTLVQSARITMAERGMRVEQVGIDDSLAQADASDNVFIANFDTHRFWFLDRRRRLVHEIPVARPDTAATRSAPGESIALARGRWLEAPCGNALTEALYQGETLYRGRRVEQWQCPSSQSDRETHWYSPELELVMRIETANGFVGELSDVQIVDARNLDFSPPSHYRRVEIEELIKPGMPIGSYSEQ